MTQAEAEFNATGTPALQGFPLRHSTSERRVGDMENRIKEQQLDLFAAEARQRLRTPAVSVLRRLHAHARLASF